MSFLNLGLYCFLQKRLFFEEFAKKGSSPLASLRWPIGCTDLALRINFSNWILSTAVWWEWPNSFEDLEKAKGVWTVRNWATKMVCHRGCRIIEIETSKSIIRSRMTYPGWLMLAIRLAAWSEIVQIGCSLLLGSDLILRHHFVRPFGLNLGSDSLRSLCRLCRECLLWISVGPWTFYETLGLNRPWYSSATSEIVLGSRLLSVSPDWISSAPQWCSPMLWTHGQIVASSKRANGAAPPKAW